VPESFGFTIGGCWYRLQCRERVCASIASLACIAGQMGAPWLGMRVLHTSNLWTGRCEWLRGEMNDEKVKWAIAVDSDTSFDAAQLLMSLKRMESTDIAIGCAPVRVGGTGSVVNLNLEIPDEELAWTGTRHPNDMKPERRITMEKLSQVLRDGSDIASGGFGVAVFHLDWFREHWPDPSPELRTPNNWVGEDIAFCQAVRYRGGRIIALPVSTEHHEFKA
jgi:hypothetical protein